MMFGAAHFWLKRKGFYFTSAGGELPLVWGAMLMLQVLIGDGPFALGASTCSLPRAPARRRCCDAGDYPAGASPGFFLATRGKNNPEP
jgi:hypothetical protein